MPGDITSPLTQAQLRALDAIGAGTWRLHEPTYLVLRARGLVVWRGCKPRLTGAGRQIREWTRKEEP